MLKKIFKIKGMHCTACAMDIDGELEDTEGINLSNTNYAKEQTEVVFDELKIKEKEIIRIVSKLGYSVSLD